RDQVEDSACDVSDAAQLVAEPVVGAVPGRFPEAATFGLEPGALGAQPAGRVVELRAEPVVEAVAGGVAESTAFDGEPAARVTQPAGRVAGEVLAELVACFAAGPPELVADVVANMFGVGSDPHKGFGEGGAAHGHPQPGLSGLFAGERGDDPHPFLTVLPCAGCRSRRPVQVVELDVRVGLDTLGARERQQGCGLQELLPPLDPQGVQDVEVVAQRQVGQP
ncbi:hypothetical protein, partial [Nonomuraea sp. NPDC049646]|uniref:hypothetical protein n=1 Tax=unclassified Nonomuraea TaxID=2593643 RepID=UPI0037A5EAFB